MKRAINIFSHILLSIFWIFPLLTDLLKLVNKIIAYAYHHVTDGAILYMPWNIATGVFLMSILCIAAVILSVRLLIGLLRGKHNSRKRYYLLLGLSVVFSIIWIVILEEWMPIVMLIACETLVMCSVLLEKEADLHVNNH